MVLQRVRHDLATKPTPPHTYIHYIDTYTHTHIYTHTYVVGWHHRLDGHGFG